MSTRTVKFVGALHALIILLPHAQSSFASESNNGIVGALTDSAIAFLAQGKKGKAEDFLLRALANDEKNVRAMFELAKLDNLGEVAFKAYCLSDDKARMSMLPQIDRLFPVTAKIAHGLEDYDAEQIRIMKQARDILTVKECKRRLQFKHEPVELNLPFDPVGVYGYARQDGKKLQFEYELRANGEYVRRGGGSYFSREDGLTNTEPDKRTVLGTWKYDEGSKILTTIEVFKTGSGNKNRIDTFKQENGRFCGMTQNGFRPSQPESMIWVKQEE